MSGVFENVKTRERESGKHFAMLIFVCSSNQVPVNKVLAVEHHILPFDRADMFQ